ncbi:heavy-metal-associated domain-containing protein [Candidatus Wolfebacteria bacterium]|nr:heavy-metal-associated domain-containing protein [Candidatus Wolfebacteria bacterium]
MEKLILHIEGMHCGACATGIQMLVSQMEGVKSIFVDYESKKGEVEFDPVKVSQESIFKNIEDLGYKASAAPAELQKNT